jgi:hypothetical protein
VNAEDSITRAIQRTVLASRCLDGAAEDVRAFAGNGALAGEVAVDVLQGEALRLEQIAETIEGLRD